MRKLKDNKIEEQDMYLGAKFGKMNIDGVEVWTMSAEQYIVASVQEVEAGLAEQGLRLPIK